jgi:hypothetical protein
MEAALARRIDPFFLVIVDDDRHVFSVVGPLTDDTNWNKRVCDAQDQGRGVRCYTPGPSQTREQVIQGAQQMGLQLASNVIV